ncbi:PREDICTED: aminopeptidase [Prunus dulcis]|uniref:PREDICTED: aminopeptidase n=1 Tax=Prunus dulcis TaxID=3755 RepID=A0A5E4F7N9_PRUDU|nr:PREDICTED: aminopeptidase [Prunus dulcis]
MRNASISNRKDFESLLNVYREANTVQEKERILRFLASSPDPDTVLEVLNFFLSDEENWDLILSKYGAGLLLTHFVRDIVTPLCSNERADEVEEFFASRVHPAISMTLKQSTAQVRIKVRWVEHIRQQQSVQELVKELAGKK